MNFIKFTEIMETYTNGNLTSAVEAIDDFGWYDFMNEVEDCPEEVFSTEKKLEMLIKLIRTNNK